MANDFKTADYLSVQDRVKQSLEIQRAAEILFKQGIEALFLLLGEDVTRDGLDETPDRVLRAFREQTKGYSQSPASILATEFEQSYDEMIVLREIDFYSLCEHHLLPFYGHATVGYIPNPERGVVGLSKLARLVDCFANRLQIQERLTEQIAQAIETHLGAKGVGVIIDATHQCMTCRGVKKSHARMTTSALKGVIYSDQRARSEFLRFRSI